MAERASQADSAAEKLSEAPPSRRVNRSRDALLALATVGTLAGGAAWVFRPPPASLEQARILVKAGAIDEASSRILLYLADHPEDVEGYQFLSSLLDRDPPAPDPARVLNGLDKLSPRKALARSLLSLNRGKSWYRQAHYDDAEAAWLDALQIDPTVPEAVWALLSLYYIQGRDRDARKLALAQYRAEPDPRDRVLLLLQLLRSDAQPPAPGAVVLSLSRIEKENPKDLHSMIALGLALVDDSRADEGIAVLQKQVPRYPGDLDALEGLLLGLNLAGDIEGLTEVLKNAPPEAAGSSRLAWFQGRAAESRRDWKTAARSTNGRVAATFPTRRRSVRSSTACNKHFALQVARPRRTRSSIESSGLKPPNSISAVFTTRPTWRTPLSASRLTLASIGRSAAP